MSILESFLAGKEARRVADAAEQINSMQAFIGQNGQAIMAGDQNALGQLAGYGVAGLQTAMGIQGNVEARADRAASNARATKADARADQQWQMGLEDRARALTAEQRAAEAATYERAARIALSATSEEDWNRKATENGAPELVGRFGDKNAIIAELSSTAEYLKSLDVKPAKDPAAEQKIQRLMETGLDRETAIGIVDGRLEASRDPVTGAVVVVDVAKAPRVGAPAPVTPAEAAPATSDPTQLDFGPAYPDANTAFGLEGAIRGAVNTATDVIGAPPAFPETMAAQNDFALLKEKLINDIASGYGRQPPSWLLKNIEDLTPQAGSVFTGPEEAQSKLRTIGRDLQKELATIDAQMGTPMSPTRQQELEARRAAIVSGLGRVGDALKSFSGPALRPEVESRMDKYK